MALNTWAPRGSGEKPQLVLPPWLVPRGDILLLRRMPRPREWGCTCGGQGWDRASEFQAREKLWSRMDWKALLLAASLLLLAAQSSDPSNSSTYHTNITTVMCTPGATPHSPRIWGNTSQDPQCLRPCLSLTHAEAPLSLVGLGWLAGSAGSLQASLGCQERQPALTLPQPRRPTEAAGTSLL